MAKYYYSHHFKSFWWLFYCKVFILVFKYLLPNTVSISNISPFLIILIWLHKFLSPIKKDICWEWEIQRCVIFNILVGEKIIKNLFCTRELFRNYYLLNNYLVYCDFTFGRIKLFSKNYLPISNHNRKKYLFKWLLVSQKCAFRCCYLHAFYVNPLTLSSSSV